MDSERQSTRGGFRYPRYDELPDELMFVDDVVAYVNSIHAPLPPRVRRGKTFTRAMATNYVKGGLTPPAIGRRYGRDHLALILFAATAKLCFSSEEVYWLAGELFRESVHEAHDRLASALPQALAGGSPAGREGASATALAARIRALSD